MRVPIADLLIFAVATAVMASAAIRALNAPAVAVSSIGRRLPAEMRGAVTHRVEAGIEPESDTTAYAQLVIDNDVFRLSNTPASVRYTPLAASAPGVVPLMSIRPQLTLKAIVGGPPWQAMIDGMPGLPSAVVRSGQLVGALTVKAVGRDTVLVQGMDTTWKLTLHGGRP